MFKRVVCWMDKALYPKLGDNWDDQFLRKLILKYLNPQMEVLDLGGGQVLLRR